MLRVLRSGYTQSSHHPVLLLISTYILNKNFYGFNDAEPQKDNIPEKRQWFFFSSQASQTHLKTSKQKLNIPNYFFFDQKNVACKKCLLLTTAFRADVPLNGNCKMWGHSCIHCSVSLST